MPESQLQEVLSCTNLPSLPAVAVQLLELTSDPDVAMSDIAKLVQQDQALAAKVLKTVNSSFYGLSTPCGSIDRAMGYLGLNTVKSLVLGFSLVETTKGAGNDGFDIDAHWRRAIIGATGSRAVAKIVGGIDPEEAFTAALFQDMGMLAAFSALKEEYTDAINETPHRVLCSKESDTFGFDHTQAGNELAKKWKLPEEICEAIRCHHNPEISEPKHEALARVVSIGTILSDAMDEKTAKSAIRKIERVTCDWYAKKAPNVGELLEEVAETSKTLAKMFDQEIGHIADTADLLAQAQEKGIEHQVSLQREAEELARQAHIDGLTQIANRKRFDAELDRVYADFNREQTEFGVLFFDADKFKSVNDTYGHAAGDAVLVELAKRTVDTVGDRGLVCRYGGEEFAVVMQNASLDECAELAEVVRATIADKMFDLSKVDGVPDELPVTVSIGVSTANAGSPARLAGAEQIVQEADECVYAAKASGRNNVKVWGRYSKEEVESTSASSSAPAPAEPVTPAPVSEMKAPAPTLTPVIPQSKKGAKNQGRILLVEDDSLAATLVISLIKRRSNVDIQWVKSGTKACVLLESGKYSDGHDLDLILCDYSLPGCNGHEVLRVAKGVVGLSDVPFYMLTGNTDVDMKDESLRLGASLFIHKDEFCADVNKWLGEVLKMFATGAKAA
ncbi:MAG: HDOD domain-containing protein [Phycisphaerales bacterium]|nr:HDOD domain-containing protein [Phycisphaerales bacterium]